MARRAKRSLTTTRYGRQRRVRQVLPLYTDFDREREVKEGPKTPAEPYRTNWRIDYARLVHSPAFRRLQGKTQLFPGESDFFRNRLTHSIEVAQIAKSIAIKINYEHLRDRAERIPEKERGDYLISEDLVEFAALGHDLGHPPFGHNGEIALDQCMLPYGGFEGNAQTMRILTRVEKKRTAEQMGIEFRAGRDLRRGLNLSHRSLAAILKYDSRIPVRDTGASVWKGYYATEHNIVLAVKRAVFRGQDIPAEYTRDRVFKTVECQIMDIADDIAYSTYDFEDAMKADFSSTLDLLRIPHKHELWRRVAFKVWKSRQTEPVRFDEKSVPPALEREIRAEEEQVRVFLFLFCSGLTPTDAQLWDLMPDIREIRAAYSALDINPPRKNILQNISQKLAIMAAGFDSAENLRENGYLRARLTSDVVHQYIQGLRFDYNPDFPALSKVTLSDGLRRQIEILKHYTYEAHVEAARMQTLEFRGREIVTSIFDALAEDKKHQLLPEDWRRRCQGLRDESHRRRCISDFIAGMTDRYAVEFYNRITSAGSIFKDV